MRKAFKRIGICFLLAAAVWGVALIADRQKLRQELIRMHVVAASDSVQDQALKLRVRDAILESLQTQLENAADMAQAREYLQQNLPKIEAVANQAIRAAGGTQTAQVSLAVEEFGTRIYDNFSLPAGLYESLRITIGAGEGKNWWCVVFPTLCFQATAEEFEESASCAGFSDALTGALEGKTGYEIRFYLLDTLGRLENFLHRG